MSEEKKEVLSFAEILSMAKSKHTFPSVLELGDNGNADVIGQAYVTVVRLAESIDKDERIRYSFLERNSSGFRRLKAAIDQIPYTADIPIKRAE